MHMYACIVVLTRNSYAGAGSGPGGDDPPGDGGGASALVDGASSSAASRARRVSENIERKAVELIRAMEENLEGVTSIANDLRELEPSATEDGRLVIDAALTVAGQPRTMAPPLDFQVAQGSLKALSWQRSHGIIARSKTDKAADGMARAWGKLKGRCIKSIGPRRHEQQLPDRERRLVELIAQLIDAGRAAEGRDDTPPQRPGEQRIGEARLEDSSRGSEAPPEDVGCTVAEDVEQHALKVISAWEENDLKEMRSSAEDLRILAGLPSMTEEDYLVIDAALAVAERPPTKTPPLDQLVARDCLRVLSWQRAHGSIARNRDNEAADRIAKSWSMLRTRCGKSVGNERSDERSKKQLIGRERRLVELTTKLIEVELGQWKRLAREVYLGFRSEFGDGFETNLQWIFKECAMGGQRVSPPQGKIA